MDYKNGKALEQPLGSGAIASTCSQYQCRFKRTGQFRSLDGDEAFLALATLHRNGRRHRLFPHDQQKE
jgi:transposase